MFENMLMPFRKESESIPSLDDLWLTGKQVIALGSSINSTRARGLLWPRSAINQPWANTPNPDILADFLYEHYGYVHPVLVLQFGALNFKHHDNETKLIFAYQRTVAKQDMHLAVMFNCLSNFITG